MEDDSRLIHYYESLPRDDLHIFSRTGGSIGSIVLGPWAKRIAVDYMKSASIVKPFGSSGLPSVFVNDSAQKDIIRDALLVVGVTVNLHEREVNGGWRRVKRGSPGNLGDFEGLLFDFAVQSSNVATASLLAVEVKPSSIGTQCTFGCATVNATLRTIGYVQYSDSTSAHTLDALMTQFGVKELLYSSALESVSADVFNSLKRIADRIGGVQLRPMPASAFSSTAKTTVPDQLQPLLRKGKGAAASFELNDLPEAAAAVSCLIAESGALSLEDSTNKAAFTIDRINLHSILRLDAAAISALDISSPKPAAAGSTPTTILAWLDRAVTGMGSRLMRQYLHQPLRDAYDIVARQTIVDILVNSPATRDRLRQDVFRNLTDLDRLNRRLQRGTATLKEIYGLRNFIPTLSLTIDILNAYQGSHSKVLADEYTVPLTDIRRKIDALQVLIDSTITVENHTPRINPNFDDDLFTFHEQLQELQEEARKETHRVMNLCDWSEKILKCEPSTNGGLLFRVSRKEDKPVRENSKQFKIFSTTKEGVKFYTEKLDAISEDMKVANSKYEVRQRALLLKLVETVATYVPLLDDAKELLGQLDVFASWALVVTESRLPMVRPEIIVPQPGQTPRLELEQVRHPLVELRQGAFVANDVRLSDETGHTWIVTGPNMGGKSTLMRSVGVAVVLAHAGCFVPATRAVMTVRDAVLCRVGAVDFMSHGLSTFMVEMLESSAILSSATDKSFVIVDELGRGTSTFDGFGLAWAIGEELATQKRAQCLFASHFHELSELASVHKEVKNVHVTAEAQEKGNGTTGLRFLYKLGDGPTTQSFGVNVAKLAGMPASIVKAAEEKAMELEVFHRHHRQNGSPLQSVKVESSDQLSFSALDSSTRSALRDVARAAADGSVPTPDLVAKVQQLGLPLAA